MVQTSSFQIKLVATKSFTKILPFIKRKVCFFLLIFLVIIMIHSFLFFLGEKDYYEKQFATLRSFEEVDSLDSPNVIDEVQDHKQLAQHERAIKISNWANIFLLAFKVI